MFIPLKDRLPTTCTPWITTLLIVLNVLIWGAGHLPAGVQAIGSTRAVTLHDTWIGEYGAVPCEVLGRCTNRPGVSVVDGGVLDPTPRTVPLPVDARAPWLTLLTGAFLHGSLLHLFFNMVFLWVFGTNVEDSMQPLSFLGFYVGAAMLSGLAQALVAPDAVVPVVGASGAIAATIGAYVFLYPRARVLTMVFFPIFLWLPAWMVGGAWAVIQFVATWKSLFAPTTLDGSVAYMAHASGFAFGLALVGLIAQRSSEYERLYGGTDDG